MAFDFGNTQYFSSSSNPFAPPLVEFKAVGDINQDGLVDIVTQQIGGDLQDATPLVVALGKADGSFAPDAAVFGATVPEFVDARVMIGDFTGDGITDLAVYDAGFYDWSVRMTRGGKPVLLVGSASGQFTASDAMAVAAQPYVQAVDGPHGGVQMDLTMGVKDVIAADIDGDGDLDQWIESAGSHNMASHFLINNGNGSFAIDIDNRVARDTLYGTGFGDYWRYGHAKFLDINLDGAPDLVLGQIRDNDITHINQSSFVLLNDGHGYYPASGAVRLPLPDFYFGYTSAEAMDAWDINRDGRQDLVIVHTRNDDVSGPGAEQAWTGTYIQVLIQGPDGQFIDETASRIGAQSTWSSASLHQGDSARSIQHADLNGDGIPDFVLGYSNARPAASTPVVFIGHGDGSFSAADPAWLTGSDAYFGEGVYAVDINRDAWMDFIHLDSNPGANGTYDGVLRDDYMSVVTQLGKAALGGGGAPAPLTLSGTAGDDTMTGGQADDTITAQSGDDLLKGLGGNDTLAGGDGLDTALYTDARANHVVSAVAGGFAVADPQGSQGTDHLTGVERLQFVDGKLALDLDGAAGRVAKVLGAVFGAPSVSSQAYVGIGLGFADAGMDVESLMQLALSVRLGSGASNEQVVSLLYTNLMGAAPSAGDLAMYSGWIASGSLTQAGLGVVAAETAFNLNNIGVVGLQMHGLAYV